MAQSEVELRFLEMEVTTSQIASQSSLSPRLGGISLLMSSSREGRGLG